MTDQLSFDSTSNPHQITDCAAALRFMFAGNAYFTLKSKRSGRRYTYRVKQSDDEKRYFVALLSGPDNTADYIYLGQVRNGKFERTAASKMSEDSIPVVAFVWAHAALAFGMFPTDLEFWHEGCCGRCGRKLTVPESIAAGIGPECAGRL